MKVALLFLLAWTNAAIVVDAFEIPAPKQLSIDFSKAVATATTCASLLFPNAALANERTALQVDVDAPYLLNLAQSEAGREKTINSLQSMSSSLSSTFGPAFSVGLPTDIKNFAKEALSGEAAVIVNGEEVEIRVVDSSKGSLTLQIDNTYLPALPLKGLEKDAIKSRPPSKLIDAESTLRVNVDSPYLVDLLKNNQGRKQLFDQAGFYAKSLENQFGSAVSIKLPSDLKATVRDALQGEASLLLNGNEIDIKVVGSAPGALTVKISNDLIPAVPFAGLDTTPMVVNAIADAVADSAPEVLEFGLRLKDAYFSHDTKATPFWEKPVLDGALHMDISVGSIQVDKRLTPVDIAGILSLGVGFAYASSFGYYKYEIYQDELAAVEKKAAIAKKAAERKAAEKAEKEETAEKTEPILAVQETTEKTSKVSTSGKAVSATLELEPPEIKMMQLNTGTSDAEAAPEKERIGFRQRVKTRLKKLIRR